MAEALSRIVGPTNVGNGTNTIFTGTAAHTYSIRSIIIVNNTSGSITVKAGIGGVTDALLFLAATAIGPGVTFVMDTLIVMSGTETLQTNATATGSTITVCGLEQS